MDAAGSTNRYAWKGRDREGRDAGGEIDAPSPAMARAMLRRQGVNPRSVKRKSAPLFGGGRRIRPLDIAVFARQLATTMKAGIPLVQSFDIVAESLDNPRMRDLVMNIRAEVAAGTSLTLALEKHPQHFDELFINPVSCGEASGTLDTMLDRVATHKEKSAAMQAKIKKAMAYPAAVVAVALIVTGVLLVKVVPRFADTFADFGADLPAFTLLVMNASDLAREHWPAALALLVLGVLGHRRARRSSAAYRARLDRLALRLPVAGTIVRQSAVARFARTLATTYSAGVPLVEALDSVAGATGNVVYAGAIRQVRDQVVTGATLHGAVRGTGVFPPLLLQMVLVGEESGSLDTMLEKVAVHYESAVDDAVEQLGSLLEPLIIALLGVLVGGVMIALYLPIFMLGSVV